MIILKQGEAAKRQEVESETTRLRRGQSSRSYMEAPPPSYEELELSPDRSPSFPEAQVPNLSLTPRALAQSRSHSTLQPFPSHPASVYPNYISPANASTPALTSPPLRSPPPTVVSSPGSLVAPTSSNSPPPPLPIRIPTFTPSTKKSLFSTQSGNKKRNAKEVRLFVLSQLTHLLQNQTKPQYTVDAYKKILKSCADACTTHELDLSALLQEKSVEEHTPFYWSIAQRPSPSSTSMKMPDLLRALLVFGHPLTEGTKMDVRRACLMMNDPELYQALRTNKYYVGSEIAQGATSPEPVYKDRVIIEDKGGGTSGHIGEFTATLEIPRYNERETIQIEFIAQRRLWRLTIRKTLMNSTKWKIGIGLLDQSPATYLDSRFILQSLNAPPAPVSSSRTRTCSDSPRAIPAAARSFNSSPGPSSGSSSSYGYGVQPSEFVVAAYSGYSPEKMKMAYHRQQQQRLPRQRRSTSPRTNLGSTTGTSVRHEPEIFLSASNVNHGRGEEDDEFSVYVREMPPLSAAANSMMVKEVRLKSNTMISAGKKEVESEMDVDVDVGCLNGRTMRARFEARLAKPESECVIC